MAWRKEQNKSQKTNTKEFKINVIKMFKELEKNDTWQTSKKFFKAESDNKKAEIFELETIVAKLQNSLGMFNNRLDQAEEMMRHLRDTVKCSKICTIKILE